MSELMSGLRKFFTKDRVLVLVIFILLSICLVYYSSEKNTVMDGMSSYPLANSQPHQLPPTANSQPHQPPPTANSQQQANKNIVENMINSTMPQTPLETTGGYSAQNVANPSDLLPKDDNSQWSNLNPSSQKQPNTPDLLQAGYHIGLDTVSQTLKNPNLQLRSDPIITKKDVGPWNLSTVEPDLARVPLEVGSMCPK